jgi:antitoxin VapB
MVLSIEDHQTISLVRELMALTGEALPDTLRTAVRQRLGRERRARRKIGVGEVLAVARRIASKPVVDPRAPDEIIGYDKHGLPS